MLNIINYLRNKNQNYDEGHLTPIRMTIIKKSTVKFWRGCEEKGTYLHSWWGYKLVQPLENSMEVPQKTELHVIQQSHSWAYTQTKL